MTNQEEAIIKAADDGLKEFLTRQEEIAYKALGESYKKRRNKISNATLKDTLNDFYCLREDYIDTKINTSDEGETLNDIHVKIYLALKESIKENVEASDLLNKFGESCNKLGALDTKGYYKQGLRDGLDLINTIKEW